MTTRVHFIVLFVILHILQVSSWQKFNRKRFSNTPSNPAVNCMHHRHFLHEKCWPWSWYQDLDAKCYIDYWYMQGAYPKSKDKPTKKIALDVRALTFLSTITFICALFVHSEVSAASVGPEHGKPGTIDTVVDIPSHKNSDPNFKNFYGQIPSNIAISNKKQHIWVFENGEVILPEIINVDGLKMTNPRLLGSGAGGAVFVLRNEQLSSQSQPSQVALKVSWKDSTKSVSNECDILKKLQETSTMKYGNKLNTIETCLGKVSYEADVTRIMIILQPVFIEKQALSLQDFVFEPEKMIVSVTLIIRTLLQMLSANIVTIDVQPLISYDTGQILFVDFTEATTIDTRDKINDVDTLLIQNFINEMSVLMPESLHEATITKIFMQELVKYPIQSRVINSMLIEHFIP